VSARLAVTSASSSRAPAPAADPGPAPGRICFVLASNVWGGAEIHTVGLANTLVERGHTLAIVELDRPVIAGHRALLDPAVSVSRAPSAGAGAVYRALRPIRADVGVLVKGWPQMGTTGLDLACRLAFRGSFLTIEHLTPPPRPPKATRRHLGGLVPGLGLWWYAAGLRVYVRSIFPRKIVTVSKAIARELIQDYGFPASKVVPILHGVDADRYAPDPRARAEVRSAWGVPDDAIVFGTVARLSNFHKGLDTAIDLFARLCASRADAPLYCVLVGTGPDEAALEAQARDSGWGSRIRFPGATDRAWEALSGMDVFLMPSRFEGLGLALLEAMACGCCPVVMSVGGIRDVMTDATLGWAAPPHDTEAFLRGMQAAVDIGPAGRAAMGARTRQHVLTHFRAGDQSREFARAIETMMAGPGR
jgi:glycosyltransferase involved in cell wall biosynthesis